MRLSEHERPGRTHLVTLAAAWAGWLFDFYDLILYTFLLSAIGAELGFGRAEHAWILGLSLGATAVGGLLFGALADRYGRKPILQVTILTFSAGTFLSGLAVDVPTLAAARVLTGLGVGGEWATGHALVSEVFPPRLRGRFGALMQTGAPLGVGLAAIVGSFAAPAIGWRACFMVSALPALLITVIRKAVPESDVWLESSAARSGRGGATAGERVRALLTGGMAWRTLRAFVLTTFNMSAYWFTFAWLPTYLREERGMGIARSGLWILVIVCGELLGYLTFGLVSDRWGRKPAFTLYASLMGSGLLGITLGWDWVAASPALLLAAMSVVGIGTGTWSNFGPYFSELFPTWLRNTAMGTVYNMARGVQFAAPIVVQAMSEQYRLSGGIALAAFFSLAAAAWVWTLPETRGRVITAHETHG
ncbi:MAG TPA: MFS transporter [Candidatus Polarisedimenticolia bacterium]|nr:MFS transporter [Candidatus Polarisedimenticolia bacterium]